MKSATPWEDSRSSVTHGKLAMQGERRNEYALRLHAFFRYLQFHVDVVISIWAGASAECVAMDTWAPGVSDWRVDEREKETEAVCDIFRFDVGGLFGQMGFSPMVG